MAVTSFRRLCGLIEDGQRAGVFRRDVDPRFAAISTIAQVAYFSIARPGRPACCSRNRATAARRTCVRAFARHAADFAVAALAVPPRRRAAPRRRGSPALEDVIMRLRRLSLAAAASLVLGACHRPTTDPLRATGTDRGARGGRDAAGARPRRARAGGRGLDGSRGRHARRADPVHHPVRHRRRRGAAARGGGRAARGAGRGPARRGRTGGSRSARGGGRGRAGRARPGADADPRDRRHREPADRTTRREAEASATAGRRDAAREALQLLREGTRPERIQAARAEVASARAALGVGPGGRAGSRAHRAGGRHRDLPQRRARRASRARSVRPHARARRPRPTCGSTSRRGRCRRVHQGQHAVAVLDGYPDRPIPGQVVAISPRAEFTPRIALTEEERADLLFGVKVALSDTTGLLRPGLPATVELERRGPRDDRARLDRRRRRERTPEDLRRARGRGGTDHDDPARRGVRLSRSQRLGQDDDHPDALRPDGAERRQRDGGRLRRERGTRSRSAGASATCRRSSGCTTI